MNKTGSHSRKVIAAFFIVLSVTGFSSHAVAGSSVQVKDAWIPAPPPSAPSAVVYMVLKNSSAKEDVLIALKSSSAGKAMTHMMSMEGGMMSMRPVEKIAIPAHGSTKLHSGGFHIMLSKLRKPLKAGDKVDLTLEFENAGKITLFVPVMKRGMGSSHDMGH